jgi:hypothetical protein
MAPPVPDQPWSTDQHGANVFPEEDRDQIINMMSLRRWRSGAALMNKGQEVRVSSAGVGKSHGSRLP